MGVFAVIGLVIAETIGAAVIAVTSAIAIVSMAIVTTVASISLAIVSMTGGLIGGVLEGLGIASAATVSDTLITLGLTDSIAITAYTTASAWVGGFVTAFSTFLEVIHFKTLLKIHEIAYIVSEEYRGMMNKVYARIGEVSEALGFDIQFINLALRNARAIVLDVGSTIGRHYDIGEATWLNSLGGFLKKWNEDVESYTTEPRQVVNEKIFNTNDEVVAFIKSEGISVMTQGVQIVPYGSQFKLTWITTEDTLITKVQTYAEKYKDNPGELFHDIDMWLVKDTVDAGAEVNQTMFASVASVIEGIKLTVGDFNKLKTDTDRFVHDLPDAIQEKIGPAITEITNKFDHFVTDTYAPSIGTLDKLLGAVEERRRADQGRTDLILGRLSSPSKYLGEIDMFSDENREQEENEINAIANRSADRDVADTKYEIKIVQEGLSKIRDAATIEIPQPEVLTLEPTGSPVLKPGEAKPRHTWNVGDY